MNKKPVFQKLLFVFSVFLFFKTDAQPTPQSAQLSVNDVRAKVWSSGDLFHEPGFEVPAGSGNHTIYASHIWIGGYDTSNVLHVSAQTYRSNNKIDFNCGPLDTVNVSIDLATVNANDRLWISGGTWPAHGDSTLNQAKNLAPFIDANNDGKYNTQDGDEPCAFGDNSLFFMFNDVYSQLCSGGTPMGLEVHGLLFGYNATGVFDNVVFVTYKIINRSKNAYKNTYLGVWTDFDIGDYSDDYIGCDVGRSAYFGYNGDANDGFGIIGEYGTTPPAQATIILQGPVADTNDGIDNDRDNSTDEPGESLLMTNFMYYNDDLSATGKPTTDQEFYNYMTSKWKNGTTLKYGGTGYGGGTNVCKFAFPDSSDQTGIGTGGVVKPAWSEDGLYNMPGDRRGVGSCGPFTFNPGEAKYLTVAYLYSRATAGNHLSSLETLEKDIDYVRQFAQGSSNNQPYPCNYLVGMDEKELFDSFMNNDILVYPNPSAGQFNVKTFNTDKKNVLFEIFDYTGRVVSTGQLHTTETTLDLSTFTEGLYLLKVAGAEAKVISVVR